MSAGTHRGGARGSGDGVRRVVDAGRRRPVGAVPKAGGSPTGGSGSVGRVDSTSRAGTGVRRAGRWGSRSRGATVRLVVVGFAVLATLVVAALFSPLFDMDHLEVTGMVGAPADAVSQAVGVDPGTALFGIRAAELRARVESLPWVAHAEVTVSWPDRVLVEVMPHRPIAVVSGDGGAPSVLTSAGVVLSREDAGPLWPFTADLPEVTVAGSEVDAGVPEALAVLEQLRPVTTSMVGSLHVDRRSRVVAEADVPDAPGKVELVLGSTEELPAKAVALESMLGGVVDRTCMAQVDVSVPSRVTVLRAPGCTVDGAEADRPPAGGPEASGTGDD